MTPKRLKQMRERAGMTQDEVAKRLNITRGAVGHWERGKNEPAYDVLRRLAQLYNTSTAYLIGETNDPTPLSQSSQKNTNMQYARGWEQLSPDQQQRVGQICKDIERLLVEELLRDND